ncbi:MAG TPA: hypothetical protein VNE62_01305, partial [Actinomycetota bacterium]|nr:hypothetical protein [Actinomycetota bacterium]
EAGDHVDQWLRDQNLQPRSGARAPRIRLATELRTLRFGEHVAENEIESLSDYFVETSAFDDVLSVRNTLFVGRKGTGKTANMLQAAARLSEDPRNLTVVIKPASYEFSSLVALLNRLPVSLQHYFVEALWKFLLTSEIANRVVEVIEGRAAGIPYTEDEKALLSLVDKVEFGLRGDFGERFERTLGALETMPSDSESAGRDFLTEALHAKAISALRSRLGPVLKSRHRVAVLIDNLDKGWERGSDLDILAKLLLGLLGAVGRVAVDFSKEDYWRERINLTVATFLRSDIFSKVLSHAREPDKIPATVVSWNDPEVLLRVLEERFLAARPEDTSPDELWARFFCESVEGAPTRDFLAAQVLHRPRDLIYLSNAAVRAAVDRRHERIEAEDVMAGLAAYSQFAFEALLVENGITVAELRDVLYEFLGEESVLTHAQVEALVQRAGITGESVQTVIGRLLAISFLGLETAHGRFEYPEVAQEAERAKVLARKVSESSEARYCIHPAFRAYLEVS